MTITEAKQQIVLTMKKMYRNGMINLFEGNISMRWEDRFLITPTQADKETMTEEMILEIDEGGNVLNPEAKTRPSSEYKMHIRAYQIRPDIQACVHSHSQYATAYAMAGLPIQSRAMPELLELFGEIPLVPYGRHGTDEIFRSFSEILPDYNCVLLANHGVLAMGEDLLTAWSRAEAVEKIAGTLLMTRLLGGEKPLPEEEAEALAAAGKRV